MAVLRADRKDSRFEVLANAQKIRREFSQLFYHNFGYKKRRVYPTDRDGRQKTQEEIAQEQARVDSYDAFMRWQLARSRETIDAALREMTGNIVMADSIWATNLAECDERRLCQDRAIGCCFQVTQELQYILETMLFDINRFTRYANMLRDEIHLLKAWRKSDNKVRKRIAGK